MMSSSPFFFNQPVVKAGLVAKKENLVQIKNTNMTSLFFVSHSFIRCKQKNEGSIRLRFPRLPFLLQRWSRTIGSLGVVCTRFVIVRW